MRLNLSPSVEEYVLFDGITITARPALSEVMEAAKASDELIAMGDELRQMMEAEGDEGTEVTGDMVRAKGRAGVLLSKAVAELTIESWQGVEDPDGSPAPVTPDRIRAFMDVPAVYDKYTEVYLAKWLTVVREKNDSAPSPTGTSEGATRTAKGARKSAGSARGKSTNRKR